MSFLSPLLRAAGAALLLAAAFPAGARAKDRAALPPPPLTADSVRDRLLSRSALLYDATTGTTLYAKNIDDAHYPASTTKLMTAILVYEKTGMRGFVTVEPEDTYVEPSHVPLIAGERVSVDVLMHSLLIASDNDTAMALGRTVGGTLPAFVDLMNSRAAELGCTRTHFVNPNGLPASGHLTTARDLLRIFQKALTYPILRQIMETQTYSLVTAHGSQTLHNHNRLLGKYPGMGASKTGWTLSSRHTFAASANRDGHELELIILDSPDKWRDAVLLFDYGFANLPPLPTPPTMQAAPAAVSPAH